MPRKARPARWEDLPQDAVPYAVDSRAVALHVRSGESTIDLEAHCRVGVWTTLQRIRALPFIVRESWGRLGERPPRRLSQSVDDILTGVIARVRPLSDGALEFRIEVAQGYLAETRDLGEFEGRRILLPRPRRYGYRFAGRVPRGHAQGPIAAWLPAI